MIRVALLDDHPAVLNGLERLIDGAPGLETVAVADDAATLFRRFELVFADVVIVDYDLTRDDGVSVCLRLKERARPPAVVLYSAYAGPALKLAARIAGADALVDKGQPASALLEAVRRVADGERLVPDIPLELRNGALRRLDPEDLPVASMRLAGTSDHGIAEALSLERREVVRRVRRIVGMLRPAAHRNAEEQAAPLAL